jgi:hypothetical protein
MPRTPQLLVLVSLLSTPTALAAPAADDEGAAAGDSAEDEPSDDAAGAHALGFSAWHLTIDGHTLIDSWRPGGAGQAAQLQLGWSMMRDWFRIGIGVHGSQGPATPLYCLPCGGTPIPAHATLAHGGVLLALELHIPYGPVQPFVSFSQLFTVGMGTRAPAAPSALVGFSPKLGLEVPIGSAFALRLFGGMEAITHRWILGEPVPLEILNAGRLSPHHDRLVVGAGLSKQF